MSICHGCNEPIERAAQIRTYHAQCDPQGRVEMLERALHRICAMEPSAARSDAWTMWEAVHAVAAAALAYKPAQLKGKE